MYKGCKCQGLSPHHFLKYFSTLTMYLNLNLFYPLLLSLYTFPLPILAQVITASLDYGSFQGAYSSKYNITYYQKIPFAAPPIGNNRFRAPQPPLPVTNGTYNSTQTFPPCPQKGVSTSSKHQYFSAQFDSDVAPLDCRFGRLSVLIPLFTPMDNRTSS